MLRIEDIALEVALFYRVETKDMFGEAPDLGKLPKHARDMVCLIAKRWNRHTFRDCTNYFRCKYDTQYQRLLRLSERMEGDPDLVHELDLLHTLTMTGRLPIRRSNGYGHIHYYENIRDDQWHSLCGDEGEIDEDGRCNTCERKFKARPRGGRVRAQRAEGGSESGNSAL